MNKKETDCLPVGWVETDLQNACEIIQGQSPPGDTYNTAGKGLPFFQGKTEFGALYPTPAKWCTSPTKISHPYDILLSIRAPVGPTNVNLSEACIGRGLAAIRPSGSVPYSYILYVLRCTKRVLVEQATGTTFEAVSGADLRSHRVPIAPLPEQHRIVEEIEKQFSRLDAAVAALKRVKANLKRYRASLLKAACEGRLVPNEAELARKEGREYEPADALLKRILVERRTRWEADQLAKMTAQGRPPLNNAWKTKYQEPAAPDVSGLSELPEGWRWASLLQSAFRITDGTHQPPKFVSEGIPFLFIKHIIKGYISFTDTNYVSRKTYEELNNRCPVGIGDILYSAVGSYGVAVPVNTLFPFTFQRHIAHIKPSKIINQNYLVYVLNSEIGLSQAHRFARGVAQKTVALGDLSRFVIPLPPLAEQERIVAEVERRLSIVEGVEASVNADLKRAERLRQSILQRAFSGKLVPQDPNDEPASVLLERIRAEREAAAKEKRQKVKKTNPLQAKKSQKTLGMAE